MQEQEGLNPRIPPSENPPKEHQQLLAEIARAKESADHALREAGGARFDTEQCLTQLQTHRRSFRTLWGAVVALGLVLAGITWYGYSEGQKYNHWLTRLPGMDSSLHAVSQRLQTAEEQLQSRAQEWASLLPRVADVEKKVSSNLRLAQDYARTQANEVHRQFVRELDNHTEWIQARLLQVESNQESERAQVGQLQQEIADARRETAQQIAQVRREVRSSFDILNLQAALDRRVLTDLAGQIEQRRVDFELVKDQRRELVPGVSLTVNRTDVRYQRVKGWLQLVPDGRTLWVRDQGILQPLFFFKQEDSRPYEVVFTRVTPDSVIGYVLVPGGSRPDSNVAASGDPELAASALPTQ